MSGDLGTRLLREGLLGRPELERALSAGARSRRPLPYTLVELGLVDEDMLLRFFRARFPFEEATRERLARVVTEIALLVPREMSEEFGVVAVGRVENTLSVAMVDPSNTHAIDEVAFFTNCYIVPLVARPSDLDWARDQLYPAIVDTAPLRVPLPPPPDDEDDAVLELVTRRTPRPPSADASAPRGGNEPVPAPLPALPRVLEDLGAAEDDPGVSQVIALTRPRVPGVGDWSVDAGASRAPDLARRAGGGEPPVRAAINRAQTPPPSTESSSVTAVVRVGSPASAAPAIPPGADIGTLLGRLHRSTDRDEVVELSVSAAALACRRAAFFVVKKAVAQGWEARGQGVVAGAIRSVWIPISSPSVLRQAATALGRYVGPMADTIANGILVAALGSRADRVGVWPIVVRERAVALLYADGFSDESIAPVEEIVHEIAQAFERIILEDKTKR